MQERSLSQNFFEKSKKVVNFTNNERKTVSTSIRTYILQSETAKSEEYVVLNVKKSFFKEENGVSNNRKRTPLSTKPSLVYRTAKCLHGEWHEVNRAAYLFHKLNTTHNSITDKSMNSYTKSQFYNINIVSKLVSACVIRKRLLESNDIETNPGPSFKFLDIITYNVNGLKDYRKQKRVFNHLSNISKHKNELIYIQETHLTPKECESIKYHWKGETLHSPGTGASAGVSIFYNNNYFDEILEEYTDNEGRLCSITARKNDDVNCYINIYAPNNHQNSLRFFIELENHIQTQTNKNANTNFYIGGDFNVVLNHNIDSVGRNQTNSEKLVVDQIKRIMLHHSLIDSYRINNKWGGFTWGRDNPTYLRSRLDIILIPKDKIKDVKSTEVTVTPKESDHSWVTLTLNEIEIPFGKGILRCNSTLLNDQQIKQNVLDQLQLSIDEIPDHWNPHQKLDFLKAKIRDNMIDEGRKKAKLNRKIMEHVNVEIERLLKQDRF